MATEEIIEQLRRMGVPEEAIERARERDDAAGAIFDAVLMPARLERTVSLADIEQAGGLPVDQTRRLIEATGLPGPRDDEPCMTPEEAAVFMRLEELAGVWPPDIQRQVMRVYGRLLGRVAQAETQAFRLYAEPALRDGADPVGGLEAIKSAFEALLPMADPLITGIHRRWVEHELAQVAVSAAEKRTDTLGLPGIGRRDLPLRRPQGLHRLLEHRGRRRRARGDRAVLGGGDARPRARLPADQGAGRRLHARLRRPARGRTRGGEIIEAMAGPGVPGVHASSHRGIALAREGDYFGGTVNLAARLLAAADADELVATDPVVEATKDRFSWRAIDQIEVRGVDEPVRLHKLATSA